MDYACPNAKPGYIAEPYHIPGYGGHIPTMHLRTGTSFGRASREILEDPFVAQAPIPILQPAYCPSNCNLIPSYDTYPEFRPCTPTPLQRPKTSYSGPRPQTPSCEISPVRQPMPMPRSMPKPMPCLLTPEDRREKTCTNELPVFDVTQYPTNWPLPQIKRSEIKIQRPTTCVTCVRNEVETTNMEKMLPKLNCDPESREKPSSETRQCCPRPNTSRVNEENQRSRLTMPVKNGLKSSRCPTPTKPSFDSARRNNSNTNFDVRNPVGCSDLGCCADVCCAKEEPPKKEEPKSCEETPCCNPEFDTELPKIQRNRSPHACPRPRGNGVDTNIYRACECLPSSYSGHIPGFTFHSNGRTFGKATFGTKQYLDHCISYNSFAR